MKTKDTLKTFFFLLIILTLEVKSKAQSEWFHEGATWYYGCTDFAKEGYQKLYYNKDSIINGLEFKTIASHYVVYDHLSDSTFSYLNENAYFLRADSNIVYWYHQNLDTVYVLYNFNSIVGDTWTIPPDPIASTNDTANYGSYTLAQVDSIDYIVLNGDTLKRIFLKYNNSYSCYSGTGPYCIGSPIVEKMGSLNWLFPTSTYIMDLYNCGNLRCYEDNIFSNFNFNSSIPCNFTVDIKKNLDNLALKIFPNPSQNDIIIDGLKSGITKLQIYDIYGRFLHQQELTKNSNKIYLNDFRKGILFFRLSDGNDFFIKKITKL